jgi:hypothetical protein
MNKQEPNLSINYIYIIFLCYHNDPLKIYVQNENRFYPFFNNLRLLCLSVCVCEQKILIRFSPNSLRTIYESFKKKKNILIFWLPAGTCCEKPGD